MTDQQQPDPWATVQRWAVWSSHVHGLCEDVDPAGRWMQSNDVLAARAEEARRHAEELKAKDAEHQRHFEMMQQTQNLASSIMDEQRTQIANITSERNAVDARLAEVEAERDEAEAQNARLRGKLQAAGVDCGCDFDREGDVCAVHMPLVERLKAAHEAAMAAVGRSHAQALEKLRAERDTLRAQLAAGKPLREVPAMSDQPIHQFPIPGFTAPHEPIALRADERAAVVDRLRSIIEQVDDVLGPDTLIALSCHQMIAGLTAPPPNADTLQSVRALYRDDRDAMAQAILSMRADMAEARRQA